MPLPMSSLTGLSVSAFMQLVNDGHMRMAYSQLGEDLTVHHLLTSHLPRIERGFYVDAGAFHPRRYSNTRFLSMIGWRGINIDAGEESIAQFRQERPNDINLCVGIGAEDGAMTYYRFADGAVSTLSAEVARRWQTEQGWRLAETRTIAVRRLDGLMREVLPAEVAGIDYMNIDLEGLDEVAVGSLDLADPRFRPKILSVEAHGVDLLTIGQNATVRHLVANGYRLMAVNIVTLTFIDTRVAINLR